MIFSLNHFECHDKHVTKIAHFDMFSLCFELILNVVEIIEWALNLETIDSKRSALPIALRAQSSLKLHKNSI